MLKFVKGKIQKYTDVMKSNDVVLFAYCTHMQGDGAEIISCEKQVSMPCWAQTEIK